MARDGERQIFGRNAVPVVGDADQRRTARLDRDVDGGRARVERILDELLDHARRPLDHLARGDLVDQRVVEPPDGR